MSLFFLDVMIQLKDVTKFLPHWKGLLDLTTKAYI